MLNILVHQSLGPVPKKFQNSWTNLLLEKKMTISMEQIEWSINPDANSSTATQNTINHNVRMFSEEYNVCVRFHDPPEDVFDNRETYSGGNGVLVVCDASLQESIDRVFDMTFLAKSLSYTSPLLVAVVSDGLSVPVVDESFTEKLRQYCHDVVLIDIRDPAHIDDLFLDLYERTVRMSRSYFSPSVGPWEKPCEFRQATLWRTRLEQLSLVRTIDGDPLHNMSIADRRMKSMNAALMKTGHTHADIAVIIAQQDGLIEEFNEDNRRRIRYQLLKEHALSSETALEKSKHVQVPALDKGFMKRIRVPVDNGTSQLKN